MKRTSLLLALFAATAFAVATPLDASKKAEKAKRDAAAQYDGDRDDVAAILGGGAALGGAVFAGSRINPDSKPSKAGEPVPEPAAILAFGIGAVALMRRRRRRA